MGQIKEKISCGSSRMYEEDIAACKGMGRSSEFLPAEGGGADALQRRRAGHLRIWNGAGRDFAPRWSGASGFTFMPMKRGLSCKGAADGNGS